MVDVPPQIKEALKEMIEKYRTKAEAVPNAPEIAIDELDFAEVSKTIKPVKGSYFRIAKDVVLQNYQEEIKKRAKPCPAGSLFAGLVESLTEIVKDPSISNPEVAFISLKLDDREEKVAEDGQHIAQIRAIRIAEIDSETQTVLREQFDMSPLISTLVL